MRESRFLLLSVLVGRSVLGLAATNSPVSPQFDIIPLGTLGGPTSAAYGINEWGQVVGAAALNAEPGGDVHAFLWENGRLTDLGTLGGSRSYAYGINALGEIVGMAENAQEAQRPVLWTTGRLVELPGTGPGAAWDVNRLHQIVGHQGSGAFLWQEGSALPLPVAGSPARAFGVNDHGEIVGQAGTRAFFWQPDGQTGSGQWHWLGSLPGAAARSGARDLNDLHQVVGEAAPPGSTDLEDYHAVMWTSLAWDETGAYTGEVKDLGTLPGGRRSYAYAINRHGEIVGMATSTGIAGPHAIFYRPDLGLQDLNDLVPPGSGWVLQWAFAINDHGQIVGTGLFEGQTRGFLLTPRREAPRLDLRRLPGAQRLWLSVISPPGQPVKLEASTNLVDWNTVGSVTNVGGVILWPGQPTEGLPAHYYRAHSP